MSKYPISKEFGFYANFTPPIRGPKMAGWMGSMMKPPKWFRTDDEMTVTKKRIPGYRGEEIAVDVVEPKSIETDNCLVLYHGGGVPLSTRQGLRRGNALQGDYGGLPSGA